MGYKLTHPDTDNEIEVEEHMVSTYVTQGWEAKPGAKTPAATDAPAKKSS